MPVAILLSQGGNSKHIATSNVSRFYAEERPNLISKMKTNKSSIVLHGHRISKFGHALEIGIYRKLTAAKGSVEGLTSKSNKGIVFYQEACRYWLKASHRAPRFVKNGVSIEPPHGRKIGFQDRRAAAFVACLLNSSLFYWWYSAFSDCEHVNDALVRTFPVPATWDDVNWTKVSDNLIDKLEADATKKTIKTKQGHVIKYDEISASKSKDLIDQVDEKLAGIYGLDKTDADYIRNFDIKYRLAGTDDVDAGD